MLKFKVLLLGALFVPAMLSAAPPGKPDIVVMTQNQYLGADLTPIVAASDPLEYNLAVLDALFAVADNNIPDRALSLAGSIVERDAHLVGLQEVFRFECVESGSIPGACLLLDAAMNDHLQLTLDALADLGADYYVAGVVDNLTIPDAGFAYPGLPVFLDPGATPDVFIEVYDRDVILARGDVDTEVAALPCIGGKPSADGCNFLVVADAKALTETIYIERGFVAVDAEVNGGSYRFVNTHLEVQYPAPLQDAPLIQAAQATELLATMSLFPPASGTNLLVVGDINSDPLHPVFEASGGFNAYPPYKQFAMGVDLTGVPISPPYTDTWLLRPGKPAGNTCCEAPDLSNIGSILNARIDVIFALQPPVRVKANVLNNNPEDKTASGLWPSDHATVVGRLFY